MPPEVMLGRKIDEKADVYSFGIVLWEIVTQQKPFPDMESFVEFRRAICLHNTRPPIDTIKIDSIRTLLDLCWHKDPDVRPPFEAITLMIEEIMVDCATSDEQGRLFWKS